MIDLIFDTETTRFYNSKIPDDHPDQTELMKLGIIIAKGDEVILEWDKLVVTKNPPEDGALAIHGITHEMCLEAGLRLRDAVTFFHQRLFDIDRVVCHNAAFDFKVMRCAFAQTNTKIENSEEHFNFSSLTSKPNICTMKTSTDLLKLPGRYGKYKWPKLQEAYRALVDSEGFEGAHSAIEDVRACHRVLRALEARNVELVGIR